MPLACLPVDPSASVNSPLDVLVPVGDPGIAAGSALAVVSVGGDKEYILAGSLPANSPHAFFGFAQSPGVAGNRMSIITGRGSKVTPVVENGDPLTPNEDVYLSETPGEVSQTPTYGAGVVVLRVGRATSTTDMILVTDARIVVGG